MKGSRIRGRVRFQRVGLVAKVLSREALALTRSLDRALRRRHREIVYDTETAGAIDKSSTISRNRLARVVDLVFVLGGDGTLLSVAREAPSSTPVLGVNVGMLGFLAGLKRAEVLERLDEVLRGGFREDRRRRLDVRIAEGPHRGRYRALNDAVLHKEAIARIATFSVGVGEKAISKFRGDGLIVATTTGSTAYNLSAGGPVLYPSLSAVVLTPICPHTLSQRPLVVPSSLSVTLRVIEAGRTEGVRLTLDGQEGFPIERGIAIEVRQSASPATLLRPPETDHFDKLAEKLNWGV